jgi:hypothetical protein
MEYLGPFASAQMSSAGGGDVWVPEGAIIHIDFLGGDPQGRAWLEGTGEVAIDTLLGNDPNADSGMVVTTVYNEEGITADGYLGAGQPVALIGQALSLMLADATARLQTEAIGGSGNDVNIIAISADGSDGVQIDYSHTGGTSVIAQSFGGSLNLSADDVCNQGDGSINACAWTFVSDRLDVAISEHDALTGAMDASDRPGTVNAILFMFGECAIQSFTIYAPLPNTTGLSELSATGVTNTAPHDIVANWDEWGTITRVSDIAGTVSEEVSGPGEFGPEDEWELAALTTSDAEGNPVTYSVQGGSPGVFQMHPDSVSGTLGRVGPMIAMESPYTVTVRATDQGGLYDEQEFTITVTA